MTADDGWEGKMTGCQRSKIDRDTLEWLANVAWEVGEISSGRYRELLGIDLEEQRARPLVRVTMLEELRDEVARLEADQRACLDCEHASTTQGEEIARLRAALEAVEHVNRRCPWCGSSKSMEPSHRDDCERQAALRGATTQG